MMNKAHNAWESHLYFGKLSKTPEMNMACFIIGILSHLLKKISCCHVHQGEEVRDNPKTLRCGTAIPQGGENQSEVQKVPESDE